VVEAAVAEAVRPAEAEAAGIRRAVVAEAIDKSFSIVVLL
jgi:hypothetical protein